MRPKPRTQNPSTSSTGGARAGSMLCAVAGIRRWRRCHVRLLFTSHGEAAPGMYLFNVVCPSHPPTHPGHTHKHARAPLASPPLVSPAEAQSFTHLTYSKNKVVSGIQWLPHRKGCVAVSCTEPYSAAERMARAGRSANAYVLIWNFKDPIHPEYVMMSPFEVFAFQFNPSDPNFIAGGCFNGQVRRGEHAHAELSHICPAPTSLPGRHLHAVSGHSVLRASANSAAAVQVVVWDLSTEQDRIAKHKASTGDGAAAGEGGEEAASIPVVRHKFMSDTALGHNTVVTDLQWLPGGQAGRLHGDGHTQRRACLSPSAGLGLFFHPAPAIHILLESSSAQRLWRRRTAPLRTRVVWCGA